MRALIIDAGVGNLGNLQRALAAVGADAHISADPEQVRESRCLLLPGVGAFRPPRESLRGPLEEALRGALADGAWLLGVCIGYQLLFDRSLEFGATDGLGLLTGDVTQLPSGVELPHMGWNRLHGLARHPLLEGVGEGAFVYFVHSFAPQAVPPADLLASCTHGRDFAAICGRDRVLGTQFHPEKSGDVGLRLLHNYMEICRGAVAGH
jgi:glutamine amidotransferase